MLNYSEICGEILAAPTVSPRGMLVKEILACQIEAKSSEVIVEHTLIPDNTEYVEAEFNWYINGKIDDLSIAEHAKIWREHIQDGVLNSNYGYWLGPHGNNTLKQAIEILRADRDSRRAIALIGDSKCVSPGQRDVPCTQSMQFFIRQRQLHVVVSMRSQDIWFGFRNDLPFFQLVSGVVSEVMEAPLERIYVNVGSLHAYERHWDKLEEIAKHERPAVAESFDMYYFEDKMIEEWRLRR
jgi:thymidylate synthase